MKVEVHKGFLEDLIWMSCRYAIGRHTIHCGTHPEHIMNNFYKNMDDWYKKSLVREIRNCINDQLKFIDGIKLIGRNNIDAAFVICKEAERYDVKDINRCEFMIDTNDDCIPATVTYSDSKKNISNELDDLLVWSKLANFLDEERHLKARCIWGEDGVEKDKVLTVFPFPHKSYTNEGIKYEILYCDVNSYIEKPGQCIFISDKNIVEFV
jgi:hypothetical protein